MLFPSTVAIVKKKKKHVMCNYLKSGKSKEEIERKKQWKKGRFYYKAIFR